MANTTPILDVDTADDPLAGGVLPNGTRVEAHPLTFDYARVDRFELRQRLDDELFEPNGMPTGRLLLRDHLWVVQVDDSWWVVADFAVPGHAVTRRDEAGALERITTEVTLNHESDRVPADQPGAWDAALDRCAAPLYDVLPEWVIYAPPTPD